MVYPDKKLISVFFLLFLLVTGCSSSDQLQKKFNSKEPQHSFINSDTIKAGKYDTGKMWTFENPPLQYFQNEYNFTPSQEWLDNARMSALRFATYCSASFVSENGLIMTNDHCARESVAEVTEDDENLDDEGFWAETLEDERPVPDLFVDQLVLIKDVTDEIRQEIDKGRTEAEKQENREKALIEIEKREREATDLEVEITPLYNGGKYSLYGYKRYTDIRLVFSPESQLGFFGGDADNFTYPRYNLDCSFFRVYDEGKPLTTEHYFKWSSKGAEKGEAVFVVGNPGSTQRLYTVAQLEYLRDVTYPNMLELYDGLVEVYSNLIEENPEKNEDLIVQLLKYTNTQKAYGGMLEGLRDPVLMQRKIDFENNFKAAVKSNPKLYSEYGNLWSEIAENRKEMEEITNEEFVLTFSRTGKSDYFYLAQELIDIADQLKLPEDERYYYYKDEELDSTIENIFPEDFDYEYNKQVLEEQLNLMVEYLGYDNRFVKEFIGDKIVSAAAEDMIKKSFLSDKKEIKEKVKQGAEAILDSEDPFINYILESEKRINKLEQSAVLLDEQNDLLSEDLGRALFDVYGTAVPPDASFTLRISDGIIKGYPYNGTIAPPVTTFYGMYDRFYSFNKEFPFSLPEKWKNPPEDFDLSTPFNFAATNDITGGNSGSPVINKNAEIVGVAFDGNIESLPGSFIYTTERNRMIALHSEGIIESLKHIYKAVRLTEELLTGKTIPLEAEESEDITVK